MLEKYFQNHFQSKTYHVWEKNRAIADISVVIAVNYVDRDKKIVDKAVVVEVKNSKVIAHLYFEKQKILNRNKDIIVDLTMHKQDPFYGWKIYYSYNDEKKIGVGFHTDYLSGNGRNITDGPAVEWNPETKLFQEEIEIFDPEKF